MYPYVEFGNIKIYMTGVGIVVSILAFIYMVKYFTKRFNLDFWKFFNWIPLFLIVGYLLGSYFYYAIEQGVIIPVSLDEILLILSPYGYKFSFIGLSLGFFVAIYQFLKSVKLATERQKRIDIFLYSLSLSLVVLGIFLTLGDNFLGKQTDSYLSITSFVEDSALFKYKKVYAIGLLLSVFGIVSFIFTFILQYIFRKHGLGIFGFILLFLLMNIVFLLQNYPRHLVFAFSGLTFDIKNYWTIILMGILGWFYFKFCKPE